MKERRTRYWMGWAVFFLGASAFWTLARAMEKRAYLQRFEQGGSQDISILWYMMFAILAAAAVILLVLLLRSVFQEISLRKTIRQKRTRHLMEGWGTGVLAGCLVVSLAMSGDIPVIDQGSVNESIANFLAAKEEENRQKEEEKKKKDEEARLAALAKEQEQQQAEEENPQTPVVRNHPFPIPDPFPVLEGTNPIKDAAGINIINDVSELSGVVYSDSQSDQAIVLVDGDGELTLQQGEVAQLASQSDPASSLYTGVGSAMIIRNGGSASLIDSIIWSYGNGANAMSVSGRDSQLKMSGGVLRTYADDSAALLVNHKGKASLMDGMIVTQGLHSPGLLTQSGGVVDATGTLIQTYGLGSPVAMGSGEFDLHSLDSAASGSVYMLLNEGAKVQMDGGAGMCLGQDELDQNGMIVIRPSTEDANMARKASLNFSNTHLFFAEDSDYRNSAAAFNIRGVTCEITLSNSIISTPSGQFMILDNSKTSLILDEQDVYGHVRGNSGSELNITLKNGSTWTGSINRDGTMKTVLTLDEGSAMVLTADIHVDELHNANAANSSIDLNGFTLYVAGKPITQG